MCTTPNAYMADLEFLSYRFFHFATSSESYLASRVGEEPVAPYIEANDLSKVLRETHIDASCPSTDQ